jgi:hypothetical protein
MTAKKNPQQQKVPRVGEQIYVPTALHLSRGRDDVQGGKAKVTAVSAGISAGKPVHFVSVEEHPASSYNWEEYLAKQQAELEKEFGNKRAHPDPDDDPQFNEP